MVIQLQANRQEKQHCPINSGMTSEPQRQVQEHVLDCIAYCGVFASFLQNRRVALSSNTNKHLYLWVTDLAPMISTT